MYPGDPQTEESAPLFVGRRRELAELRRGLADARAARGRFFLLGGAAGIGKTRLASEVAAEAARNGAVVLWGRGFEGGAAPPYWPWTQAIREYLRQPEAAPLGAVLGDGASYVADLVPELRHRMPELPAPLHDRSTELERVRFALFDAVATFVRNVAEHEPLVLILDDLYAADTPSLLLLHFVARDVRSMRLLLIGIHRDSVGANDPERTELWSEIDRQASKLSLQGLTETEVGALLSRTIGAVPLNTLVMPVHRATEGNPLFVQEVARVFAAEGVPAATDASRAELFHLPGAVHEAIQRHVGFLSDDCRRCLQVAAVIGKEFDRRVVALAMRESDDRLDAWLAEAESAGAITRDAADRQRFSFAHGLIRDMIEAGVPAAERQDLHRRVGEAIESLHAGDIEPHLAAVTHHFFESGSAPGTDKAVDYAVRAGQQSLHMLAYEEAAEHYRRALESVDLDDVEDVRRRTVLLMAMGKAAAAARYLALLATDTRRWSEAMRHFEDALEINARMGSRSWLARTREEYGRALLARGERGDAEKAGELAAAALASAEALGIGSLAEAARALEADAADALRRATAVTASAAGGGSGFGEGTCSRTDTGWEIAFRGKSVRLGETEGLHYLARLLARPGEEVHVRDFALSDADPAPEDTDATRDAYRARLEELRGELAQAKSASDGARAASLQGSIDVVMEALSLSFVRSSRRRTQETERARKAVTNRLRDAIARLRREHPELGLHLERSVRMGAFCSYSPGKPVRWIVRE